jgi:5-methylcytosine-specific restriction enzyme subunit McrC
MNLELSAWSSLPCELTHAEAAGIREAGLVEVLAEPGPGRWRLKSDARIGVAVGSGWELRVTPRIEVPRLLFLLGYASDPRGWKRDSADFEAAPQLFDAIANAFSTHALRVVEQGLLRGYVQIDERLRGIRGRIRFGDQISRSALPIPVEVSYDDYTADIAENRILKAATVALLRLPRVPPPARRRLLKLRAVLDEVALPDRPRELEPPRPTRLNERYRPALRLAHLILRSSSLGAAAGPIAAVAFAFDMNRVFEDFLSISLREAMRPHGGEVRFQAGTVLDERGRVPIRPDVTWFAAGSPRAVVDAKHKALDSSSPPNQDVYQLLAYCTALRLPRGYLVYAKQGAEKIGEIEIRNADCKVCVRTVDLELEPDALLGQVARLGAEIAARAPLPAAPGLVAAGS